MNETKSTNRWVILTLGMICMLIMGVCYTYSLFQPYVMDHFGVDSASASLPYTIFIAVFCLGNFIGGQMQKKTNLKSSSNILISLPQELIEKNSKILKV